MPVALIEEKIRLLPEYYLQLLSDYIDELLDEAKTSLQKTKAGEDLLSFAGSLRTDIDEEKELDKWRKERFGTLALICVVFFLI